MQQAAFREYALKQSKLLAHNKQALDRIWNFYCHRFTLPFGLDWHWYLLCSSLGLVRPTRSASESPASLRGGAVSDTWLVQQVCLWTKLEAQVIFAKMQVLHA